MTEDAGYGAFSYNVTAVSAEIIRGDFRGAKGISTRWDLFDEFTETSPSNYIAYGSTARDSGKSIDLSEFTTHIGEYYLEVTTTKPVFTLQPEDVSIYEGGSAQFRVKAKNADSYCWYIADADDDSLQPYDWSDVESFCDVSGIESDTLIIKNAGSWLNNKAVYCEAYNGSYKLSDTAVITVKQIVRGDVNADDKFNIADAVMLQNYLVRRGAVTLWTAGDLSEDGKLDIFDLCIMKNALAELS